MYIILYSSNLRTNYCNQKMNTQQPHKYTIIHYKHIKYILYIRVRIFNFNILIFCCIRYVDRKNILHYLHVFHF